MSDMPNTVPADISAQSRFCVRGIMRVATLFLVVAAACALAAHASPANLLDLGSEDPHAAFAAWATQYQKVYKPLEYMQRKSAFLQNLRFILSYNRRNSQQQLELNEYADLTWQQFQSMKLGYSPTLHQSNPLAANRSSSSSSSSWRYADVQAPATLDWRDKGVVTGVKNQGACGSCWAFSATGAIEGINALKTGQLVTLSEQELVDCDTVTGNAGCGGGLMDYAFEWVKQNGGIDTEEDWGYYSSWGFGTWCNTRKEHDRHVVTIDGYEDVPANDEAALQKAVSQQPIAVAICANAAMQFYSSGVITECCDDLNHGVLLVGYGTDAATQTPYWLVKNSWGGSWGDKGYFKIKRGVGKGGLCGIATSASYPVKEHANPAAPLMCDPFGWQECPSGNSCGCRWPFFFNWFCIKHDCCPHANGVDCGDNTHCCPGDLPVCDTQAGTCSSSDGGKTVPWTGKTDAVLTAAGRAAQAAGKLSSDGGSTQAQQVTKEGVQGQQQVGAGGSEYLAVV